ncbi:MULTISPECIES: hypothetical protein [unclassified Pseudomonas]|uniref:hypothetical protein n=1 Tax=unclassified Pseudomonas TaxID=196821 RepID=UPI001CBDC945|nr:MULTISPECIES: hypothetical protein [unclassified Pseudomonas]
MPNNQHTNSLITKVFWLVGGYNILGVLTFSQFFTNTLLSATDPTIFSRLGLVSIMLWGVAYTSVAKAYRAVPYLVLLFFVGKMLYVLTWLMWLSKNSNTLPALFAESPLTAIFYSIYGAGDLVFGLFFLWVACNSLSKKVL